MGLCLEILSFQIPEVETSGMDMGRPSGTGEELRDNNAVGMTDKLTSHGW
ncbi:hypothetical protein GCM10027164_31960 [Algoriphagus taiwanensis]